MSDSTRVLNTKSFLIKLKTTPYYGSLVILLGILVIILAKLEWNIPQTIEVLFLYLVLISLLVFSYNNLEIHNYGSDFGLYLGYCISRLEGCIANSMCNDLYLATLFIIGISMIMISLVGSDKNKSLIGKLNFLIKNFEFILPFMICMFIFIFVLNIFLLLCGIGVSISTVNLTLFCYTLFCKVVLIRIVITLVVSAYTKEFKLNSFSLSVSSVIFMFILGWINCYYVIPLVKFILALGLTNATHIFDRISLLFENTASKNSNSESLANGTQPLAEGIYNIITKFPIIGRLLYSFRSNNFNYSISSPFRSSYNEVIKNNINIYPLTKISKFTRIDIARIVENKVELFYSYKGNISSLEVQLKNYSLYLRNLISNFVSNHSNLTCKINLICADQIVSINTTFKNGHLEEFNLNRTNLNFSNKVDKNAASNVNFLNSLLNTQCSKDLFDISPATQPQPPGLMTPRLKKTLFRTNS